MYPRTEYDLPILSLDVVSKDGVVSLGIIDPCPVSLTDKLPAEYKHMVKCVSLLPYPLAHPPFSHLKRSLEALHSSRPH